MSRHAFTGGQRAALLSIVAFVASACGEGTYGTDLLPVVSITLSATTAGVDVGKSIQLSVVLRDRNGTVLSRAITWSSSNSGIASVNGSGLVMGVSVGGPVAITANSEGRSASAQVTVSAAMTSVR